MFEFVSLGKSCWHATITGSGGEILDSILEKGIIPKSINTPGVGNSGTARKDEVYSAINAQQALNYLLSSTNYNWKTGGLPLLVCMKRGDFSLAFNYDDDISRGEDSWESADNLKAWFSLIVAYGSIGAFVEYCPQVSHSSQLVIEKLKKYSNQALSNEQIFKILIDEQINSPFFEGLRLKLFKQKINEQIWNAFIARLTSLEGSGHMKKLGLTKNISKLNGWSPGDIKKVFVISPNGDKDWRKWAKIMPPDSEHIRRWNKWAKMKDLNGIQFPGNGKLVRIF